MTEDQFWTIIDESRRNADGSQAAQEKQLKENLLKLNPDEIAAFEKIFIELLRKSYTWDLWGAAYLIDGGCSDDGFEYFRRGLIAAGRDRFENALRDPETLADWAEPDVIQFECLLYVAYDAYREKSDQGMLRDLKLNYPSCPSGAAWIEGSDGLATRFPRLWARFS